MVSQSKVVFYPEKIQNYRLEGAFLGFRTDDGLGRCRWWRLSNILARIASAEYLRLIKAHFAKVLKQERGFNNLL